MKYYKAIFLFAMVGFAQEETDSKKLKEAIQYMANATSQQPNLEEPLFQLELDINENHPLSTADSPEYR